MFLITVHGFHRKLRETTKKIFVRKSFFNQKQKNGKSQKEHKRNKIGKIFIKLVNDNPKHDNFFFKFVVCLKSIQKKKLKIEIILRYILLCVVGDI